MGGNRPEGLGGPKKGHPVLTKGGSGDNGTVSLTRIGPAVPGIAFIKAGTFDDTGWLDPKVHIYCDSKEQWTPMPEGSQVFARGLG